MPLDDLLEVLSLIQGMHLALVNRRRDVVVNNEIDVAVRHKVRHPNGADESLPVQLL